MRCSLYRAFVLLVAIVFLPLTRSYASDSSHFWTELSDSGRVAKVQSLPDFVDLAAKLSPAVVNISSEETDEPAANSEEEEPGDSPGEKIPHNPFEEYSPHAKSLGSGFIVSKDGYVLTNDHVVTDADHIAVTTQDGYQYKAKLIGRDEKSDIALLKIEPRHELPVAPLGNSDDVKVGQWVMAIGNPFGFDHSVTVGVVSAKGRFIPGNFDEFIQTDASINPGNSGGPLISVRGEVVGVNSAIYTRTGSNMGIGFAIPVNIVKEELAQLRNSGKVVRGWLGVYIQKMTPEIAESLGLQSPSGALVAEVLKGGPAKSAGIERGDVITSFDGTPIVDSRELPLLVGRSPIGHVATLKLMRQGKPQELKIAITQSHEDELASAEPPLGKHSRGTESPFGLYVKDLSPDLAKELGLEQLSGVVISSVAPGSRADEAGLRARDVILEVNREAVKDVGSYQQAMTSGGKGKIVLILVRRGDSTIYFALKPEA
ncbi:MAG TPA: DegQ family serine endoprotease [Candidatus Binataceae bacterium]|nr:DegQ family serine endoprotease [Candidatus Binataceae bacterium]